MRRFRRHATLLTLALAVITGCPAPESDSRAAVLNPGVYIGSLTCDFTCSGELINQLPLQTSFELTQDSRVFIDGDEYRVGVTGVTGDGTQVTITDLAANVDSILIQYSVDAGSTGSGIGSITIDWTARTEVRFGRLETRTLPGSGEICTTRCEGTLTR